MITKKSLIKENERLKELMKKQDTEIRYLNSRIHTPIINNDLQSEYMLLQVKYTKLLNSCLSKETENITYNGELYSIQSIDYHKDYESVDTIDIKAIHIPKEKGLINNLAEPFKNVAQELNKIFFGDDSK